MEQTIYGKTDRQILSNRKRRPLHKTTEDFITEASLKHNRKYDYSNTIYNGSHYFLTITCPVHGPFEQMAKEHLRYGCRRCAIASHPLLQKFTTEQFIEQAKVKHGNKYDYSKVNYAGTETRVEILCKIHGSFFQTPHDHCSSGAGCSQCAWENHPGGYTWTRFEHDQTLASLPGVLYLVRIATNNAECLKIGITKRSVKTRFDATFQSYQVTPILELTNTLQTVFQYEQSLLESHYNYRCTPDWLVNGRTECFRPEALLDLCEAIDDFTVPF